MGLAQLDTLRIRRINAVSFFCIIDNLTGQLGNLFRYQPGVPGRKAGQKVQGLNINLVGRIDELRLAFRALWTSKPT